MCPALDDDAPPPGEGRIVVVGLESYRVAHHGAVQLGARAVRKSTVRCRVAKLTGKISGFPPRIVTNRPNDKLDSKLQHSSSLSRVTAALSADMIQPNAIRHHRAVRRG